MIVKKRSGVLLAAARYEPQGFPVQPQRPAPAPHAEELYSQASLKAQGESDIPLLSQAYRQILRQYTTGITASPFAPPWVKQELELDLKQFEETMAQAIAESAVAAFAGGREPQAAVSSVAAGVQEQAGRLKTILGRADREICSIQELQAHPGYAAYLFFSEKGMNTCERCERRHGELLSLEEVQKNHLLPPLHPNCRCSLVGIDKAGEVLYHLGKEWLVQSVARALYAEGQRYGGLYVLDHDFLVRGIGAETLHRLDIPEGPAVTDGQHEGERWYDGLAKWAKEVWADATMAVDAFMARGAELFANAADTANENPIEGLLLFVDALTMGLVSGTAEGIAQREERFWEEPGLYNFLNALSFGGLDLVDEVINPEEPWSFAHIMNTIALVTLLYGAGKLGRPSEGKTRASESEMGISAGSSNISKYIEQLDSMSQNKIDHIINGSKNSNHGWEKLVPDKNWNDIKKIIANVMDIGIEGLYKSVYSKKTEINGFEVEVTYMKLSDGTIKISDAWVNQ